MKLSLERQNELREQYRQDRLGWQPATELYAALVGDNLQSKSVLLDLGCGRGGLVEQLGQPLNQVIGLDPDWPSLVEHRLANQQPPFSRVAGLSQSLPFSADCFDLIFSSWILEHLSQPADDFRQIGRVLRPGGVFVFITPNARHPLAGLNRLLGRFSQIQDMILPKIYGRRPADAFPAFYRANTKADLERLAKMGQMDLARLHAVADPTYLAFTPALYHLACWLDDRLPAERHIHLVGVIQKN